VQLGGQTVGQTIGDASDAAISGISAYRANSERLRALNRVVPGLLFRDSTRGLLSSRNYLRARALKDFTSRFTTIYINRTRLIAALL
jgi:hypothetical protein